MMVFKHSLLEVHSCQFLQLAIYGMTCGLHCSYILVFGYNIYVKAAQSVQQSGSHIQVLLFITVKIIVAIILRHLTVWLPTNAINVHWIQIFSIEVVLLSYQFTSESVVIRWIAMKKKVKMKVQIFIKGVGDVNKQLYKLCEEDTTNANVLFL